MFKAGDTIKFSGQHGGARQGELLKVWEDEDGRQWAHVKTSPVYVWEKDTDCIFAVCLDGSYLDHNKCIIIE